MLKSSRFLKKATTVFLDVISGYYPNDKIGAMHQRTS